jgi:hypothetical protein
MMFAREVTIWSADYHGSMSINCNRNRNIRWWDIVLIVHSYLCGLSSGLDTTDNRNSCSQSWISFTVRNGQIFGPAASIRESVWVVWSKDAYAHCCAFIVIYICLRYSFACPKSCVIICNQHLVPSWLSCNSLFARTFAIDSCSLRLVFETSWLSLLQRFYPLIVTCVVFDWCGVLESALVRIRFVSNLGF